MVITLFQNVFWFMDISDDIFLPTLFLNPFQYCKGVAMTGYFYSPHSARAQPRRNRLLGRAIAAICGMALTATGLLNVPATIAADTQSSVMDSVTKYTPSRITFPGNDRQPHEVSFDVRSFKIDGERINIWSGEFHYWRLLDVNGWCDIFQKMRAHGYNAVSLYLFWGLHQSEENGPFDFSPGTVKDLDLLLSLAEEEGLYVIARPGPYVNAEISMGGLPAYMSNYGGGLRSMDSKALAASESWLTVANAIISKHQVTDGGGSVLLSTK